MRMEVLGIRYNFLFFDVVVNCILIIFLAGHINFY